jgi:malate dehydrogenase
MVRHFTIGENIAMKVAIVGGGGGVGASVAFNLLQRDEPYECVLVDRRQEMALSHALDLEQVMAAGASGSVRTGGTEELEHADVVVMCAAAPLTVNTSRDVYLEANAEIVRSLAEPLGAGDAVIVMVTNPVDPLCTLAAIWMGVERRRIVGYTLNDSLRLRTAIARVTGIPAREIDAWVIGEHGDGGVPLLDAVTSRGAPVALDPRAREDVWEFVRGWYARHVALDSGRSSTWTTGVGVARMVAALARPGDERWPASVLLDGEYGVTGVSLTVPVTLGRRGVERVHEVALSVAEREAFLRAAELVGQTAASVSA